MKEMTTMKRTMTATTVPSRTTRTARLRGVLTAVLAATGLVAVLLTAGCGSSESPSGTATGDQNGSTEVEQPGGDDSGSDDAGADGKAGDDDGGASNAALLAAADTMAAEFDDATVVSVEWEDGHWEAEVYLPDGTKYEADISTDGSRLLGEAEKEDDSGRERAAHRERLATMKVSFEEAVDIIERDFPDGRITELELDTEDGRLVWEADVIDADGVTYDVDIDAAKGGVLKKKVDH